MKCCAESCDTFVVLPPGTNGNIIFGKNSDRPKSEVQEVVYVAAEDHTANEVLKCTYLPIAQVSHTYSVILSKPAWMWGAEMGSNEKGVAIGNEAVWTKAIDERQDKDEKLLGMDLVRLGLERGESAIKAVEVITQLLEKHGQGGRCYEEMDKANVIYHNSFIIADGTEAWVLETVDRHWAAEKVTAGVRNISNLLTIGTKIDAKSDGLMDFAIENGWWKADESEFSFAKVFSALGPAGHYTGNESPMHRFSSGKALLEKLSTNGQFTTKSMFTVLRDEGSGICRTGKTGSVTTGSQVSVLYPSSHNNPSCHWFTATPNPACSVFKPFCFCPDVDIGSLTQSPNYGPDDPAKCIPRFQRVVDRMHRLYRAHLSINPLPGSDVKHDILDVLLKMEDQSIVDVEQFVENFESARLNELKDLFRDCVESEIKFYI